MDKKTEHRDNNRLPLLGENAPPSEIGKTKNLNKKKQLDREARVGNALDNKSHRIVSLVEFLILAPLKGVLLDLERIK